MKRQRTLSLLSATLVAAALAVAWTSRHAVEAQGRGNRVQITITNLTRGQVLSPAVVALHDGRLGPLFTGGAPASDELRQVAEDAMNQPLVDLLAADPNVGRVGTFDAPIPPGATRSIVLEAEGPFSFVSLVSMLVTTNDAFIGVNGLRSLPRFPRVVEAHAYDAGTEENNELCQFIPGPPCGSLGARAMNGEGYVHVHGGVHGVGDLMPEIRDWRNPVARITVERLR